MTKNELIEMVNNIDQKNADYILADRDIQQTYESLCAWVLREPGCISILNDTCCNKENAEKRISQIIDMLKRELNAKISTYGEKHITPANAKVGDGVTINLWSDRHAGTIIKVAKASITVRQDKAILDPDFKPEFIIGGFSAHCTNQNEQKYTYEPDENGHEQTIRWSRKCNQYGRPGNVTVSKGRHEFYDYNF